MAQPSEVALKALEIAKTQLGKEEKPRGSNWGEDVQKYLNSVGINFPASWCMAFCYWCYKQAGPNALMKTGGVLAQWNTIPEKFRSKFPSEGALMIFDHGKGLGHVGMVERVDGDILHTIEGNTNDEGVREGFEVCRKIRNTKDKTLKGYIVV